MDIKMSKVKTIKKVLKDPDLANMFNSMLGDGDTEIIAEKAGKLKSLLKLIGQLMENFATGGMKQFTIYKEWLDEFHVFGEKIISIADKEYKEIKDHNVTRQIILICRELVKYSQNLTIENLNDRWIGKIPGLIFEPFAFTKLDLKHIWGNDQVTPIIKEYCLKLIALIYRNSFTVYQITTSPDIDVKKFSRVIIESIEKVKGVPALNRCKEAFDKIKESVALLETNFGDYYKDMVQSENPNTIIENFILDVSKGQNMNLKLMRQFRTIINFYKNQSAGKIKDPKVQKMFDSLNERLDTLETKAKQSKTVVDDKNDSDSSDTDQDDEPETKQVVAPPPMVDSRIRRARAAKRESKAT